MRGNSIFSIVVLFSAMTLTFQQINNLYSLSGSVDTSTASTPLVDNTAFGTCTCDKTLNSCDTYCCCDTDCTDTILNYWKTNYNFYCTRSYIGSEYKPFSQCISMTHIYGYNKRLGMEMSEQNGQLCVELDTGSIFSGYQQYITSFNDSLTNIQYDMSSIIHSETATSTYTLNGFKEGDRMQIYQNSQFKNFPIPQPDQSGHCNNFNGPSFLKDSSSKACSQKFTDLSSACTTYLNPQYMGSGLSYLKGSSQSSSRSSVQINNFYKISSVTNQTSSTGSDPSTYNATTCSCTNALKEAQYTTYYSRNADGTYVINNLAADQLVYENLTFNAAYCSNDTSTNIPTVVEQSFSFKFKAYSSSSSAQYKSGNPGYKLGLPLLIGEGKSSSGRTYLSANGFNLFSGDDQGNCFKTLDSVDSVNYPTSTLNFGGSQYLTCNIQLTAAQLESYCSQDTTKISLAKNQLQIFSQILNNLQTVGIFGNANINYQGDWITPLTEDTDGISDTSSTKFVWDATTKTCTHIAGLEFQVMYSKIGYVEKPQRYIVAAKKKGIYDQWRFTNKNSSANQTYTHSVSVSFVEVLPDELINDNSYTSGLLPKLPSDLFYPLAVQSDSSSGQMLTLQLAFIVTALLSLIM